MIVPVFVLGGCTVPTSDATEVAAIQQPVLITNECSADQIALLEDSVAAMVPAILNARQFYADNPDDPESTRMFGAFDQARYESILAMMQDVADTLARNVIYNCNPGVNECTRDDGTWVTAHSEYYAYTALCPNFWQSYATYPDALEVLLHEPWHWVTGGRDYAYGGSSVQQLAQIAPELAYRNPDSYSYFVRDFL
jgi:hypothetical protein